ncbi:MAG: aminotransferase class V-fold PLP-dependent enzyme [Clostridia bacterium]|nr:aminotransferase class V-fold PLP-dependent enzyme [Clostridia bacterium]
MIRFECDYSEGACPEIIKKLEETNMEQTQGYSEDIYCNSAREKIKKICKCPNAEVQFLVGGTQTNMIVISSILKPYQGVISAQTGHINMHETGAIEATGHKVLVVNSNDGKLTERDIKEMYQTHYTDVDREHMVQPGMVYISYPTENGIIYTKKELENLYKTCKECNLPLYIDGARLGYGLMSEESDMDISDIAQNCDIFYIGGTKVGALFGEAVVITNKKLQENFRYCIKQRGGMLAKGRLLGIQFDVLFENGLYFNISKHAVDMAMRIKKAFTDKKYNVLYDSNTNQQFPILPNKILSQLSKKYSFCLWEKVDESNSAVRFCTSWATKEQDIDELVKDIENLKE